MRQIQLLKKAKKNLPREYLEAISRAGLHQRIKKVGKQNGLTEKQIDILDQEVIYLILYITDPADFTKRMTEGIDLDNEELIKLMNDVNDKILRPLKTVLDSQAGSGVGTHDALDIPVPPPPSSDKTPNPSYGGSSDPYREPVDN